MPSKRLDDISPPGPISLIKIDVEGYEPAVLSGATMTLRRTESMILEYDPNLLKTQNFQPHEFLKAIATHFPIAFTANERQITPIDYRQLENIGYSTDLLLTKS